MDLDREGLLKLYNKMTTIRHFEERGIPETGQRGMSASVHSSAGQEAVPVGVCANLTDEATLEAPTGATATASPRASTLNK